MKKSRNYSLLIIVIFSHVFGFYFLSTSFVSLKDRNVSSSSAPSFDLLRFVKRRKEKDYVMGAESITLADAELVDSSEVIKRNLFPFFRYIKLLNTLFTNTAQKIAVLTAIPPKLMITSPRFDLTYHRILI